MQDYKLKRKVLFLFLLCECLCFTYILINGEYVSDYLGKKSGFPEIIIIATFLLLISLYVLNHICWNISEKIFQSRKKLGSPGNINFLMFMLILIYFVLVLKTGVGKVGAVENVSLTFMEKLIFLPPILLKVNFLVYIYAAGNKYKNKLYYINIFLFLAAEISRGISFSLLLLVLIEYQNFKKYITLRYFLISFVLGMVLVNVIYNVKFYIRMGDAFSYIGFYESLIMLFGRLSIISNFLYIQENINPIREYIHSVGYVGLTKEFLESLTPMPSLFGIDGKVIEFGKILFSYSNVTFTSATAASVLGILYILPEQILPAILIFSISIVIVQFLINKIEDTNPQQIVAYFFFLLTLYQGFMAILSNYIYALIIYIILISIKNMKCRVNGK